MLDQYTHYTLVTSCKHNLVLLRMVEIIARNMSGWLKLLINCYCCVQLVVYTIGEVRIFTNSAQCGLWNSKEQHLIQLQGNAGNETKNQYYKDYDLFSLVPIAARSEAWVCGSSLAGIVGSNPAGGMDVCLLWVLCCVDRGLRVADHSSRVVLVIEVCLSVIVKPRQQEGSAPKGALVPWREKKDFSSRT